MNTEMVIPNEMEEEIELGGEIELGEDDLDDDFSEIHSKLVQWVEDSENYFIEANELARRDRNYFDGRQWSDDDYEARMDLGLSAVTSNRIGRKIRFLLGMEISNRTSAKALPRTPVHEVAADDITEALRYVAEDVSINQQFSTANANLLVEGIEILEVTAKYCHDGSIDPQVISIPWDRFIYDPFSRRKDFGDARYVGVRSWFDMEVAVEKWPDKEDLIRSSSETANDETYDDVPRWNDLARDRVTLVQLYWKEKGAWQQAIFTKTGFIVNPSPSFYVDEYETPECPIIAGFALMNQDNERYGLVREMIDVQDTINVCLSNGIDFSRKRQTVGERGAVADVNEAKRELQKPGGHVQITPGMRFEVLPTVDLNGNNLQVLQIALAEIEMMGPNAAMLGKDNRAPSGRAILASQEGGQYEHYSFSDCHNNIKLRTYRAIWNRIKQFWTEEKWIRVLDDKSKVKFVGFNVPVTYKQLIAEQNNGQIPQEVQAQYGALLDQVATVKNQISNLDVDIVIEQVPYSAVAQYEQFDNLIEMMKISGPQAIPIEALIEVSPLRDKDKFLKKLEENKQQSSQQGMMQVELMSKKIAAEIEQSLASARKSDAEALTKTLEAQFKGLQLQTYGLLTPPVQPPPALQQPPAMQQNPPPPGMPAQGEMPPQAGMMGVPPGVPPFSEQAPPAFTGV